MDTGGQHPAADGNCRPPESGRGGPRARPGRDIAWAGLAAVFSLVFALWLALHVLAVVDHYLTGVPHAYGWGPGVALLWVAPTVPFFYWIVLGAWRRTSWARPPHAPPGCCGRDRPRDASNCCETTTIAR